MKKTLFLLAFSTLLSSCGLLNQSIMFRTDGKYKFDQTPDYKQTTEYKISANDILSFDIYSNDGAKLINFTTRFDGQSQNELSIRRPSNKGNLTNNSVGYNEYLVDADGFSKLPIIGRQQVSGLTIREVEKLLEGKYSDFYLKPFIIARVTNRNVILFPGNTGDASIINLDKNNTTLIQLIAQEGGISINGKAKVVKLIRYANDKHEVYLINLATIKGIDDAHIVLQANDLIYIEPRRRVSVTALKEITPLLTLVSTTLLSLAALNALLK